MKHKSKRERDAASPKLTAKGIDELISKAAANNPNLPKPKKDDNGRRYSYESDIAKQEEEHAAKK